MRCTVVSFFFQAEDGIRDKLVTGVQTCALPICMTTATNAVIQRSGGRVAFITNEGFRDLLLIGRQNRPSLYDIRKTRPQPLVAREDCHTVRGRLDPTGRKVTPLDEGGLRDIAERLRADRVEAVAI